MIGIGAGAQTSSTMVILWPLRAAAADTGRLQRIGEQAGATWEEAEKQKEFDNLVDLASKDALYVEEKSPEAFETYLRRRDERNAAALRKEASDSGVSVRDIETGHQAIRLGDLALMVLPGATEALAGIGEGAAVEVAEGLGAQTTSKVAPEVAPVGERAAGAESASAARRGVPDGSVGAMRRLEFKASPNTTAERGPRAE